MDIPDKIRNINGEFLSKYTTGKVVNFISDDLEQIGASFTIIFFDGDFCVYIFN
ncbi:hypothetical protein [Caviibacter abscessus]|uniref:hypothetical protein n=1 Tax=Caviibacter abscessus TaxID=1766719 RepID=UPI000A8ECDA0|nr:hypothetical protein [Caviibacter abscessus]